MRGYFAIGAEGISKPMNLGALMRTANAFGAAFVFSVKAEDRTKIAYKSDTSRTFKNLPYYQWDSVEEMHFPKGIKLVGIELTDDAVELPEFRHPRMAAYVLGPERGNLSGAMVERCDHVVKIPTRFCINVSLAGALVMYDRVRSMGHWKDRPVMPGGPARTD
ncbi:MAG: RNA methyltransferase [Pseudomonadota bacterium]